MSLEDLIGSGLRRERASVEELRRFRDRVRARLADAQLCEPSLDSRFHLAYDALMQISLGALRCRDLRPDPSDGEQALALHALPTTLGLPREKIELLNWFRRQRDAAQHDGSFSPTGAELHALISVVLELQALFEQLLAREHPELG